MNSLVAEQTQVELVLSFLAEGGDEFTSGEALSDKLGLSRTAVWKHVEALRRRGYRIDAVQARGYKLVEIPDKLSSLELTPLLGTRELGAVIHYSEQLDSTNELAQKLAKEGAAHGEIVICDTQTAGKGRRGRSWASPPAVNLYFSAILRPDLPPTRAPELTLVAAVALAETLRESGVHAAIKWPNDIMVGDKKIAGILTELACEGERVQHVILGVGVNLNSEMGHFPPDLQELATSVRIERGHVVPRALFTAALWTHLESWLDIHSDQGFEPIRDSWRKMSNTLGCSVLVKSENREWVGIACDIDESGALWVEDSQGKRERVLAGEVHRVRVKDSHSFPRTV